MTLVEQGHLGGYRAGGDEATWYPELWTWLVQERGIQSVIDVGCGEGHAVDFFASLGIRAIGVDGVVVENDAVLTHDYTLGSYDPVAMYADPFDLCWSCEFVEHVEEQYLPNFLTTFACADLVLMTHAEPGQSGYHHVNCQPANYWIGVMAAIGYRLDGDLTRATRLIASENPSPWNHFRRSGLAFARWS